MIEINGKQYEAIDRSKPKKHIPKSLQTIMMMAAAMPIHNYYDMGGSSYTRELPKGTNIVEEFKLIQEKKSKLPKVERDMVERAFHYNFKEVTNQNS